MAFFIGVLQGIVGHKEAERSGANLFKKPYRFMLYKESSNFKKVLKAEVKYICNRFDIVLS